MKQQHICPWLGLSCKHTKNFFHLPAPVRELIYLKAGLDEYSFMNLVVKSGPDRPWWPDEHLGLFNASRAIREDVQSVMYSQNKIIVSIDAVREGLEFLLGLSPTICSELRLVYVHLYLDGPLDGHDAERSTPLPNLSWRTIELWQDTCTHLLAHTGPRIMGLNLICDTGDSEKTEAVLQPLFQAQPGVLRACGIRLKSSVDHNLRALAHDTAMHVMGYDTELRDEPFRFMDLPEAIQLRILKFTDLVTPCAEVEWSPGRKFHITNATHKCRAADQSAANARTDHAKKFLSCHLWHTDVTGSFCSARHSSYFHRCHCWSPPTDLMLVSRKMHTVASKVFFSCNRLILLPDCPDSNHTDRDRLALASEMRLFVRDLADSHALEHLQTLEIVLPGLEPAPRNGGSRLALPTDLAFENWFHTFHYLEACANLSDMTLVLHMQVSFGPSNCLRRASNNREPFEDHLAHVAHYDPCSMLRRHVAFLEPIDMLREAGLQRLYIHLEWDWHWTPPQGCAPHMCQGERDPLNNLVAEMEMYLEKAVMGRDYDSAAVGKMEQWPSQWMMEYDQVDEPMTGQ